MALLIKKNNNYIRLELDGTYYIYASSKDRTAEKKATTPREVNNKYWNLLTKLSLDKEALHYVPNARKYLEDLEAEHKRYCQNCGKKITTEHYPLMKKYIKDVDKTIPNIIDSGRIGVQGETLEDVYNFIKKYKVFGETEDI